MKFAFWLLLIAVLAGCSKPMPTAEEELVMKVFASFYAAESYDKVCNNPRIIIPDAKDADNLNWAGNQQFITARLGNIMHKHHPDLAPDAQARELADVEAKISLNAESVFRDKGCTSDEAKESAKAFTTFIKVPPSVMSRMMDETIKKTAASSQTMTK